MITQNCFPDFITVCIAGAGTDTELLKFADGVGMSFEPVHIFVNKMLVRFMIKDKFQIICSRKIISGCSILKAVALGADICNSAREFMFSLGCIQAMQCNNNECPTGVTTQDKMLMKELVVKDITERVFNFHINTLHSAKELLNAQVKKALLELTSIFSFTVMNLHIYPTYIFRNNLKNVTKH